jgi:hypothetical protein
MASVFFFNRNSLEGVIEEKWRVVSLELARVVLSVGSTVDSDAAETPGR